MIDLFPDRSLRESAASPRWLKLQDEGKLVNLPLDEKGSPKEASRILIIGTSGSGKTWLAGRLSGLPEKVGRE